jgi:hypothetical protein
VPAIGKVTIVVLLRNLLVGACKHPERTLCLQFCSAWSRTRLPQLRLRRNRLRRSHHKCFADNDAPSYFPFSRYPIEGISPQRFSILYCIIYVFYLIRVFPSSISLNMMCSDLSTEASRWVTDNVVDTLLPFKYSSWPRARKIYTQL